MDFSTNLLDKDEISIEIWIASHIFSLQRLEWTKEMLLSLKLQTDKNFTVYWSFSCEKFIDEHLKKLISSTKLDLGCPIFLFPHIERKTQFEHIQHILDSTQSSTNSERKLNNFILFCDDDDMYHKTRVEKIRNIISKYPDTLYFKDHSQIIQGIDTIHKWNDKEVLDIYEVERYDFINGKMKMDVVSDFGNIICKKSLIEKFFENDVLDKDYIEKNKQIAGLIDCAFSSWLQQYSTEYSKINEILYLKRIEIFTNTRTRCWDKQKDFNFDEVKDGEGWGLQTIYFQMSEK
jgi:hypothetical protein